MNTPYYIVILTITLRFIPAYQSFFLRYHSLPRFPINSSPHDTCLRFVLRTSFPMSYGKHSNIQYGNMTP